MSHYALTDKGLAYINSHKCGPHAKNGFNGSVAVELIYRLGTASTEELYMANDSSFDAAKELGYIRLATKEERTIAFLRGRL